MKKAYIGATVSEYTYMPDGRRLSKTVDGVTTSHIWDGSNIVADTTNGITTKFIRSNKLEQLVFEDTILNYKQSIHGDIINSGDVEYTYDAFGNLQTEAIPYPFEYCGEYFDEETGFIYLRNRYYDSSIGRFTQEDPIRDGLNWYAYCSNNPIMFVDSTGLYYIEANKTYCNCADPRCRNWGVPTGTYTLKPDNIITSATRGIVNLSPGGSATTLALDLMTGTENVSLNVTFCDVATDSLFSVLENAKSKIVKTVSKVGSTLGTIKYTFTAYETVTADKIAFDLLKRNNISTTGENKENLKKLMAKSYEFIANNTWYFSKKYDGSGTLYEIDNKINKSKNPNTTIKSLVNRYEYALKKCLEMV